MEWDIGGDSSHIWSVWCGAVWWYKRYSSFLMGFSHYGFIQDWRLQCFSNWMRYHSFALDQPRIQPFNPYAKNKTKKQTKNTHPFSKSAGTTKIRGLIRTKPLGWWLARLVPHIVGDRAATWCTAHYTVVSTYCGCWWLGAHSASCCFQLEVMLTRADFYQVIHIDSSTLLYLVYAHWVNFHHMYLHCVFRETNYKS